MRTSLLFLIPLALLACKRGPATEVEADADTDADTDTDTDADTDSDTDADTDTDTDTDADTDSDTDADTDADTDSDTDADTDPVDSNLVISEVVDHADVGSIKYIELCNRGTTPVSLDSHEIRRYSNGNTTSTDWPLPSGISLAAGEAFVIASDVDEFTAQYGMAPDANTSSINGNGDDTYELYNGSVGIDVYGEIGVDGDDEAWFYQDSVAQRVNTVTAPTTAWVAGEWVVHPGTADPSNPGNCDAVPLNQDTGGDTGDTSDTALPPMNDCPAPAASPFAAHVLTGPGITRTPYTNDAGIGAIIAADPGSNNTATVNLVVTGAHVVAMETGADPIVWFADAGGGVRTFGVNALEGLSVGDTVDFTVTEIENFFGELEITVMAATPTVTSSNNPVHVFDMSNTLITQADHRGQMVEFYGRYDGDSGEACGNGTCVKFTNGTTENTMYFGSNDTPPFSLGDCVHLLTPVEFNFNAARMSNNDESWWTTY